MAKYSKKAGEKVERAMDEMKKGTLKSGGNGRKVTNPKQAIAIGLSEARDDGAKVPYKNAAAAKKTAGKKTAGKKAAKKKVGNKSAAKKSGSKKSPAKKIAAKKSAAKKSLAKKTARKK